MTQIYGVSLLRNEDLVAAWALGAVVDFCDRLLILDNGSTDRTRAIVEALAARRPHVEIVDAPDAYDTHRFVEPWAGRDLWVLGVDGDEIYDPAGLARFRRRLLDGAFADAWSLRGDSLHLVGGTLGSADASGFRPPHARSITKLYNFAALESWRQGRHQRLHGKAMAFRPGWSDASRSALYERAPWDETDFRCLHLCFLPRSSQSGEGARANPLQARSRSRPLAPVERLLRRLFGLPPDRRAEYKRSAYAAGPLARVDVSGFGTPADHAEIDPRGAESARLLQAALDDGRAAAAAGLSDARGMS